MFNNSYQRKPMRFNSNEQSTFIEGLAKMLRSDLFSDMPIFDEFSDFSVKTDDFTQQLQYIISDTFAGTATVEENNVITMLFSSGELFNIRITKQ